MARYWVILSALYCTWFILDVIFGIVCSFPAWWLGQDEDLRLYRFLIICLFPLLCYWWSFDVNMSRLMTKPAKWLCAQRRLRSALASVESDQSLRCAHEESFCPELSTERTPKTLIRLGGCPGWYESSLDAQSFCLFCHEAALIWSCPTCKSG